MKKLLIAISVLVSANLFSAEFKSEKGSMDFPNLKIEKVEGATYMALDSKSGEAYVFGLANDVILDAKKGISQKEVIGFYDSLEDNDLVVELYNVDFKNDILTVEPTYEDFKIIFTKEESKKIINTVKGGK
ncbi:MAG: hypothetical protein ACRDB6_01050 [Cetobacterium sp.]